MPPARAPEVLCAPHIPSVLSEPQGEGLEGPCGPLPVLGLPHPPIKGMQASGADPCWELSVEGWEGAPPLVSSPGTPASPHATFWS